MMWYHALKLEYLNDLHLMAANDLLVDATQIALSQATVNETIFMASSPLFTSEVIYASQYKKGKESLVTSRDMHLITALAGKEKMIGNMTDRFAGEETDDIFDFTELLSKAIRNKKDTSQFLRVFHKKDANGRKVLYIETPKFCMNARLQLTYKFAKIKRDADQERFSLDLIRNKEKLFSQFNLEDYWFYEQKTGVNLSVEICALIDKMCCENGILNSTDKEIIVKILADCIEKNYRFIAFIPVIDWKISVMKVACTVIMEALIGTFCGKNTTELERLANQVIQITRKEIRQPYLKQETFKKVQNSTEWENLLLKYWLSTTFNAVLNLFVMDAVKQHIFCGRDILSNFHIWLTANDNVIWVPEKQESIFEKYIELYDMPELLQKTESHEKIAMDMLGNPTNSKDLLVFCNRSNKYVKQYICPSEKKTTPRSRKGSQFIAIQRAVRNAIETSERQKHKSIKKE